MGSRFMFRKDAAKVLGLGESTINTYIKTGTLRPVKNGHYVGVWEDEVMALLKEKEAPIPFQITRKTLARMYQELETLKSQMKTVLRLLNVAHEKLSCTDAEIGFLYKQAQYSIKSLWPPHAEEYWADIFLRIRPDDLDQMERVTGDTDPWRPFYLLCSAMYAQPYNKDLQEQLAAGRTSLYNAITLRATLQKRPFGRVDAMIKREATPPKRMMNKLNKQHNLFLQNGGSSGDKRNEQQIIAAQFSQLSQEGHEIHGQHERESESEHERQHSPPR